MSLLASFRRARPYGDGSLRKSDGIPLSQGAIFGQQITSAYKVLSQFHPSVTVTETTSIYVSARIGQRSNRSQLRTRSSKMSWKKPTLEQWMQLGLVTLFILGIVSTIIILAKLK